MACATDDVGAAFGKTEMFKLDLALSTLMDLVGSSFQGLGDDQSAPPSSTMRSTTEQHYKKLVFETTIGLVLGYQSRLKVETVLVAGGTVHERCLTEVGCTIDNYNKDIVLGMTIEVDDRSQCVRR